MTQLGSENIPIEGSEAAAKRKQQLEYQVPAHDYDPSLCHNLSEIEAEQLQQYVVKLKESCAGQGNVIRIGEKQHGAMVRKAPIQTPIVSKLVRDRIVQQISGSETLRNILQMPPALVAERKVSVFENPLLPDFYDKPLLSDKSKVKLGAMKMNSEVVQSAVNNMPYYSSLLSDLRDKNINIQEDKVLGPIDQFYNEYFGNEKFQNEVRAFVLTLPSPVIQEGHIDHVNTKQPDFNSPLPVKYMPGARNPSLQQQETPARKLQFPQRQEIKSLDDVLDPRTGQILIPTIVKDKVLFDLLNSELIKNALHNPAHCMSSTPLIVSARAMIPDFDEHSENLHPDCKDILVEMKLNTKGVQSGVLHGPIYDDLFKSLKKRRINYSFDPVLQPIQELREEMEINEPFREHVISFVEALPHFSQTEHVPSLRASYAKNLSPQHQGKTIPPSKSSDSGFDSIPPTPNYATYPGIVQQEATPGHFVEIPGIADMNMYPKVSQASDHQKQIQNLPEQMENMSVSPMQIGPQLSAKCKGCEKDIFSGEVAVKAERAGKEVVWHPLCFKCHHCNELLADLVYFFHDGEVYCGRDLAEILKIPRCSACDELIFTKEFTAAENQTFHIKHFVCFYCDIPLAGQKYVPDEKTNMPLCLNCYDQYFAERCSRCSNTIAPTEQGVSWGKHHWHSSCFLCSGLECQKSLIGSRFCVKNEQPFCSAQCVNSVLQ